MRYIDFSLIDKNDPEVKAWVDKAEDALNNLKMRITHEERAEFFKNNRLWSEFKPILIKFYGEKCWYSECTLEGSFGDVDHFRPKNKSTNECRKIILADGYWWLAYDYLNYRLSCEKCNRSFDGGGKNDIFPLKTGTLPALNPNSNDENILLDPCSLVDVGLIDCDESGNIISLSNDAYDILRVAVSEKVYNWKCFNTARREVRTSCQAAIESFEIFYEAVPSKIEIPIRQLCALTDVNTPYSSFAKKYIKLKIINKPYEQVLSKALNL